MNTARAASLLLVSLVLAACAPATPSVVATAGGETPGESAAATLAGSASSPATAAFGATPLHPVAVAREGDLPTDDEGAALLASARRMLRDAGSFRFWIAHRGDGLAVADLEPDLPLITAGTSQVGEQPAARWSITNLAGFPGRTIEYAFVDGDAWSDQGVGAWTEFAPGPQADVVRQDAEAMAPDSMFGWNVLDAGIALEVSGLDRLGAEAAVRFEAIAPRDVPIPPWWSAMDGETERFSLWVSERGEPLQVEAGGTVRDGSASGAFEMTLQVAAIDDERNRVEPPG